MADAGDAPRFVARDELLDVLAARILAVVTGYPTVEEADLAHDIARARLWEKVRELRDVEGDLTAAAIVIRVLGRLHDATESGGTRG